MNSEELDRLAEAIPLAALVRMPTNTAKALIALAREAIAARKVLVVMTLPYDSGEPVIGMASTFPEEQAYIQIRTANEKGTTNG